MPIVYLLNTSDRRLLWNSEFGGIISRIDFSFLLCQFYMQLANISMLVSGSVRVLKNVRNSNEVERVR